MMMDTVQTYYNTFGLKKLVNLICLGDVSGNGMDKLEIIIIIYSIYIALYNTLL